METENESYLRQKLEWIKYRLKILEEMEVRLEDMKAITVLASASNLEDSERQKLNHKLHLLEKEVNELDDKSRTFWMDCQ